MKNLIGGRVKEARMQANPKVNQTQLHARLQTQGIDIDVTAISKIESGKRIVYDTELFAIAKALKVSPNWLLSYEN